MKHRADVRFGSKADMTPRHCDVRFTPESRHATGRPGCPKLGGGNFAELGCACSHADARVMPGGGRKAELRARRSTCYGEGSPHLPR